MKVKLRYEPRKEIPNPNGGTYILNKVEYLIVDKEYNLSSDKFPRRDIIGLEKYLPCVRKECSNLKIISERKDKIKRLQKIIIFLELKIKKLLNEFPIEVCDDGAFEIDRLWYYFRTRKIRAEMLIESISNSIK